MQLFNLKSIIQTIFACTFVISAISNAGCLKSPYDTCNVSYPQASNKCKTAETLYDCAASSLYGLCIKSDVNVSYEDCLRFLPKSLKGNNMLEFKKVLQQLGFSVKAEQLSADQTGEVNLPCIVLLIPSGIKITGMQPGTMGHYIVLWPIDSQKMEIIDYPRPSLTINRNYWAKHLQTIGISTVPVLVCDSAK